MLYSGDLPQPIPTSNALVLSKAPNIYSLSNLIFPSLDGIGKIVLSNTYGINPIAIGSGTHILETPHPESNALNPIEASFTDPEYSTLPPIIETYPKSPLLELLDLLPNNFFTSFSSYNLILSSKIGYPNGAQTR